MKVLNRDQNVSFYLYISIFFLMQKELKVSTIETKAIKFFKKSVLFGQLKKLVWRDMKLCSEDSTLKYHILWHLIQNE